MPGGRGAKGRKGETYRGGECQGKGCDGVGCQARVLRECKGRGDKKG